jgi:pyrroloquinoline quinone (PQQ) biosynthesis protein C
VLSYPAQRIACYPPWLRRLIEESEAAKERVTQHDTWRLMSEGAITPRLHHLMLVGFWPLIEKFPRFLALNLLKTSHGRDSGVNLARSWLARNLRTEERHAEWYLEWAEAAGASRDEVLDGWRPAAMTEIVDWCWRVCEAGELAEAMAATNYAVEGATGDWVREVAASEKYRRLLAPEKAPGAMRWLEAHAQYDALHPFEALDIIAQIVGSDPPPGRVRAIRDAVLRSYELYRQALDVAARAGRETS